MKKRIAKMVLCALVLASVTSNCVYAESTKTKEISFRSIPWYSTKADTEEILYGEGASEGGWSSDTENIYRMSGIDYPNVTNGSDRVDGGGYKGWYSSVSVAGYEASDTYACYVYDIDENGVINKNADDAKLYFGWYIFDSNDYADVKVIYEDLEQKLVSLYGEGTSDKEDDYFSSIIWSDAGNNQIRLLLGGKNKESQYITLGYMAADADVYLDEMQNALDAEAMEDEAAEREENKNNVSGL